MILVTKDYYNWVSYYVKEKRKYCTIREFENELPWVSLTSDKPTVK